MCFSMAEGSRLRMVLGLAFLYKLGFSEEARYLGCLGCLRNRETWVYIYNIGDNDAWYNYIISNLTMTLRKNANCLKTSLCKTLLRLFIISNPTTTLKKNAIFLKHHCVERQYWWKNFKRQLKYLKNAVIEQAPLLLEFLDIFKKRHGIDRAPILMENFQVSI